MRKVRVAGLLFVVFLCAGCGLVYQAGARYRARKMAKQLKLGETMAAVHKDWGEPDIRTYPDPHTEIWSYAIHANSGDVTATLLYTSAKEGDAGSFMDLRFVDNKLVAWKQARHTMPPKEGPGFSAGLGTPAPGSSSTRPYPVSGFPNVSHY